MVLAQSGFVLAVRAVDSCGSVVCRYSKLFLLNVGRHYWRRSDGPKMSRQKPSLCLIPDEALGRFKQKDGRGAPPFARSLDLRCQSASLLSERTNLQLQRDAAKSSFHGDKSND